MIFIRIAVVAALAFDMLSLPFTVNYLNSRDVVVLGLSYREWFIVQIIGAVAILFAWAALELVRIHRRIDEIYVTMRTDRLRVVREPQSPPWIGPQPGSGDGPSSSVR